MMKKIALGLTIAALATAGQALAATSTSVTGFYKAVGVMSNQNPTPNDSDVDPDQFVDQRFRARIQFDANEYVKVVYFGEVDMVWGDTSYGVSRNDGGAIGGDHINLETKNIFIEAKFPGTPITATVGLQGAGDYYDWFLYMSDAAGVKLNAKAGPVDATVRWVKWLEGTNPKGDGATAGGAWGTSRAEDDVDLYTAHVAVSPVKNLTLGMTLDYIKNQGSQTAAPFLKFLPPDLVLPSELSSITMQRQDLYYLGVDGNFTAGIFNIKGWAMYNWGTMKSTFNYKAVGSPESEGYIPAYSEDNDIKVKGYGGTVKASVKVAGVNAYLRGMYFSDAGDSSDKIKAIYNPVGYGPETGPFLIDTGMPGNMIADGNLTGGNWGGYPGQAFDNAMFQGYGLVGAYLGAQFTPPAMPMFYVGGQLGYYRALSDSNGYQGDKEGKTLGTEVAAKVGYKFAGGLFDLSLNGVYTWLGDFYDGTVNTTTGFGSRRVIRDAETGKATGDDPGNLYKLFLALNVPF